MDVVSWDVHAVYELSYEDTVEGFREAVRAEAKVSEPLGASPEASR